jgi:AcrR family transcriptional regulator
MQNERSLLSSQRQEARLMPRLSPVRLQARKDQILQSALACFARKGVHPTTMRDICKEAGLSLGGVYAHFKGKQEIVEEVFKFWARSSADFFADSKATPDPAADAQALARKAFASFEEGDRERQLRISLTMDGEAAIDPAIRELRRRQNDLALGLFRTRLDAVKAAGQLGEELDTEVVARIWLALYEGLRVQLILQPDLDVDAFLETFLSMTSGGFGAA